MQSFISDVHLGFTDRETERKKEDLLLRVFEKVGATCDSVYIVGDLFDYWFEYKTVIPKYFYRTLNAIYGLKQKGIHIEYLMGNHDFGHKDFFMEEFGIEVFRGDIEREIGGKKFFLSHGDGKSFKDNGYKILKAVLRNPFSNRLFRLIHPDIGICLASNSSKHSRTYTDSRDFGEADGMKVFAEKRINEGFDYVIMGHRHKAEVAKIGNGYYINLGEWMQNPTFGIFDGEFKLVEAVEFINS